MNKKYAKERRSLLSFWNLFSACVRTDVVWEWIGLWE